MHLNVYIKKSLHSFLNAINITVGKLVVGKIESPRNSFEDKFTFFLKENLKQETLDILILQIIQTCQILVIVK